jgi:hypothetical protein
MLASGNSKTEVCVNNLLRTWYKEAPYGRRKGIRTSYVDKPFSSASNQMKADALDMLEEFEERADINDIIIGPYGNGDMTLTADIDINTSTDLDDEELEDDDDDE